MNFPLISFLLALFIATGFAQSSGLEVANGTKVYVLVEMLDSEAAALGLTTEMILSKCELQLRRNGIAVGKRSDGMTSGVHLYVNCGITGRAFANTIEFKRNVTYRVGAVQHSSLATTYRRAGQGIATDGKFVIECLIDLVDVFSNDFIKSNSTK